MIRHVLIVLQCETAAFAIKENVVVDYRIVADFPENRMYENNFKSLDFQGNEIGSVEIKV